MTQALALVLKAKIQVLGLRAQVIGLGLVTQVFGLGLGLDSVGRLDTTNSVSFDSDTNLADACSQMEFVPLGYLLKRILAVPASSASTVWVNRPL